VSSARGGGAVELAVAVELAGGEVRVHPEANAIAAIRATVARTAGAVAGLPPGNFTNACEPAGA